MKKTILLTTKEYSEQKKCTPKNVIKKIKNGSISKDKNVISTKKIGKWYLLEVIIP